jgi:mannose-1-phosphate guanylyltransferase/mannose-6-phosphate isomerase
MPTIHPVILSGGSGTRLWPLSRAMYPKQFLNLVEDERSLLGATLARAGAEGFAPPLILCNADHRFLVRDELARAGIEPRAVVLEPVARNTAPAIAVAAVMVAGDDPDGVLLVLPSDHVIREEARFREVVVRAAGVAASGKLALLGITPTSPHTGYGYIRRGAPLPAPAEGAFAVEGFYEKPTAEKAAAYLQAGGHDWNSGIFILSVRTFLAELGRFEPAILAAAEAALAGAREDLGFLRLEEAAFSAAPSISVDYAVMERTRAAVVLPADLGWSDVGSFTSLAEISAHDAAGNASRGDVLLEATRDCLVRSERGLVATIGVEGLVIVDTPDALLVADKARAQEVSGLVARLRKDGRREAEQHVTNHRPWGRFETLGAGSRFQVKRLHVVPGGRLSLQMHHHRSEHWVVVYGTAKVTIGEREQLVREGESVYITATDWHRLENPGKVPLELIEVQIGSYLGEDDIVRADDIYNRAPDETR